MFMSERNAAHHAGRKHRLEVVVALSDPLSSSSVDDNLNGLDCAVGDINSALNEQQLAIKPFEKAFEESRVAVDAFMVHHRFCRR